MSSLEFTSREVPQGCVLYNVFLNDLAQFITGAHPNAYPDDQQRHYSDTNHLALRTQLNNELSIAVDWFKHNGLIANPNKFQLMVLGDDHEVSFAVDGIEITRWDDIDLLGVNNSKFTFDKHVTNLCSKVNLQLQVVKRFRKLITGQIRLKLYNAFIQPFFCNCSDVWHFLLQLNRQILTVVLNDSSSSYEDLLTKLDMTTPEAGRVQSIMLTLYKCLQGMAPPYLRAYIQERRVSD